MDNYYQLFLDRRGFDVRGLLLLERREDSQSDELDARLLCDSSHLPITFHDAVPRKMVFRGSWLLFSGRPVWEDVGFLLFRPLWIFADGDSRAYPYENDRFGFSQLLVYNIYCLDAPCDKSSLLDWYYFLTQTSSSLGSSRSLPTEWASFTRKSSRLSGGRSSASSGSKK